MSSKSGSVGHPTGFVSSLLRFKISNHSGTTIWQQARAGVGRLLGGASLSGSTRTVHESTCLLPYEIVEMIIADLTRHLDELKACSLTCRSWYTVAAPHLHYTLHLKAKKPGRILHPELESLSKLHQLGLMPLVKEILVGQSEQVYGWLIPETFNRGGLRHFSAFTNVQALRIRGFDLDSFMPNIEHYFGHFSPTLRSIALYRPRCTTRQLSTFLSLFPNLDDIEIVWNVPLAPHGPKTTLRDPVFVHPPAPKLRERLLLFSPCIDEDWTDLITLYCGLRFRHIELYRVASRAAILQKVCAQTLETLRIYVPDGPTAVPLSRFKAFRSLQVADWVGRTQVGESRHSIVMNTFSTITSPVFSELVIVFQGAYTISRLLSEFALFQTLRRMYEIRPFKLVFLLEGMSCLREDRLKMEGILRSVTMKGYLAFLESPPTIRLNEFHREWISKVFGWNV